MKYKRILVLFVVAFLFGACGNENRKKNHFTMEGQVTPVPELKQEATIIPVWEVIQEGTENQEVTPEAAVTPIPTVAPMESAVTPIPAVTPTESVVTPTAAMLPPEEINPLGGAYWCGLYEDNSVELLTPTEIALINQENFEAEGTGLVTLSRMEKVASGDIVRMIESYSFPQKSYYDNKTVTDSVKAEIFENRNMEVLRNAENIEPKYGVLTQNADLRSFPAAKTLTSSKNGRYDYLQETVLLLSEAVVVLHYSSDGEWCFVQAENYFGWIPEASIAYCEKADMEAWYDAITNTENPDILLVTKNVDWKTEDNRFLLRMGTKLKYEGEKEGKTAVLVPVRDEDKRFRLKTYLISPEDTVYQYLHHGYVPYTRGNVIRLATVLLNTPYAWGDALPYGSVYSYNTEIGMDCSSTVSAVYRCFGFVMPRNTGAQRNMVWPGEKVSGHNSSERRELLEQTDIGTLLYSTGHVMLYLGEYEGEYYVLHNTTTETLSDGTEEAFYRCVITSMSLGEKGKTILDGLLETKVPAKAIE